MNRKVSVLFNSNCKRKTLKLGPLWAVTYTVKLVISKKSCKIDTLLVIVWPIDLCHFQWPCLTLKVTRLLRDLSNAIWWTFVQHFARFQLARCVAWSHGNSWASFFLQADCWLLHKRVLLHCLEFSNSSGTCHDLFCMYTWQCARARAHTHTRTRARACARARRTHTHTHTHTTV